MVETILEPVKELGYLVKREVVLLGGKGAAEPIAEVTAPTVARTLGMSAGTAAADTLAGMLTVGGMAAVSAGLTQMDYVHKKERVRDLYREELSKITGKSPDKVLVKDLEQLSANNKTLSEELSRSKRQRNFGVVISFAASMAALSAVMLFVTPALATAGIASFAALAIKAVVGVMAYHAVKDPLHKVADKFFALDEKTTNDHIVEMKLDRELGKIISREQVLSAYVASNPELDKLIVSNYGKHFDEMDLPAKQRVVQEINQIIPLDRLTQDINSGRINVTELAFVFDGQSSGVQHDGTEISPEHKHGMNAFLKGVTEKINQTKVGHGIERVATAALTPDQYVTPVTQTQESPLQPFVERLGLAKKDTSMGHAERIEQSRSEPSAGMLQQP